MSRREDSVRLRHMLDHAVEAIEVTRNRSRVDLDSDRLFNLALVRLIEIVGEAASRVSPELQAAHPDIPWSQIIGMRHRIIHGYDSVDFDILWEVATEDLASLVPQLQGALQDLPP